MNSPCVKQCRKIHQKGTFGVLNFFRADFVIYGVLNLFLVRGGMVTGGIGCIYYVESVCYMIIFVLSFGFYQIII